MFGLIEVSCSLKYPSKFNLAYYVLNVVRKE